MRIAFTGFPRVSLLLIAALILLCCISQQSIADNHSSSDEIITTQEDGSGYIIEITGNRRTATSYVRKLTRICLANFDRHESRRRELVNLAADDPILLETKRLSLQRCLLGQGIFDEVEIEISDSNNINIDISDSWKLLILPNYSTSLNRIDTNWGFLFADFNAFRRGQTFSFVFSRQETTSVNSFATLYEIPYIDPRGRAGMNLVGSWRNQVVYAYRGNSLTSQITEDRGSASIGFKHRISPNLSMTYSYSPIFLSLSNYQVNDIDTPINAPYQSIHELSWGLEWSNARQRYYYQDGISFSTELSQQIFNSHKSFETSFISNLYLGVPSWEQHVFQLNVEFAAKNGIDPANPLRLGGQAGARAIPPNGAWVGQYLITGLDYQLPIVSGRYGYWNIGPFFDVGWLGDVQNRASIDLGYVSYGVASYVHLRRVNIPALGFAYGANTEYATDYVSVFIGYRI